MKDKRKALQAGIAAQAGGEFTFDYPPNLVRITTGSSYQGNEAAFGEAGIISNGGTTSGQRYYFWDTAGDLDWSRVLTGLNHSGQQYFAEYDGQYYGTTPSNNQSSIWAFQADGTPDWGKYLEHETATDDIYIENLSVDAGPAGFGYIGPGDHSGNNDWYMVTLWEPDGTLAFQVKLNWSGPSINGGYAIEVTDDAVYVAMKTYGTAKSITVVKLDLTGAIVWKKDYTYSSGGSSNPSFEGDISVYNGNLYVAANRNVADGMVCMLKIACSDGTLQYSRSFTSTNGISTGGYGWTKPRIDVGEAGIFYADKWYDNVGSNGRGVTVALFDEAMTTVEFIKDLVRPSNDVYQIGGVVKIWNNGCGLIVDRGVALNAEKALITSDFEGGCAAFSTSICASGQAFAADVFTTANSSIAVTAQTPTVTADTATFNTAAEPTVGTTW